MKAISDFREDFLSIKQKIKKEEWKQAFADLRRIVDSEADYSVQHRCSKLFTAIPTETIDLKPIKIAFLTTSTLDHFIKVLKFYLAVEGFKAEFFVSEFNILHQTVLDSKSELYTFQPDIVWFFTNHRDIRIVESNGSTSIDIKRAIDTEIEDLSNLWQVLKSNSSATIIQNNADTPSVRVFGNFEGHVVWGRANLMRNFNLKLVDAARSETGVLIFDFDYLSGMFGKNRWFDESYWHHSKHAFSLDSIGYVAEQATRMVQAIKGQSKKCLVLDLDNTLWGGVIGDDGLEGIRLGNGSAEGEAYLAFQKYLRQLYDRGIILTVCSKNEEENARLPFLHHDEMYLDLENIAVFVANWDNKADNIQEIAERLEIGLDSIVFIDDNPAERELVRSMLPMVSVPELSQDPATYIDTLDRLNYFDTISFSKEDKKRGEMYKHNAQRKSQKKRFSNLNDFLLNLKMIGGAGNLSELVLSRASQLINKSNQFHLTTTRYSEAEIRRKMENPDFVCRYYRLKDRFGDNGIISVVILQKDCENLVIDTWVMSCRVLSRGMEDFIYNDMVLIARSLGHKKLIGVYIPTKKNKLVAELYLRLGFQELKQEKETSYWHCFVNEKSLFRQNHIKKLETS
jgi:FkbH-like protein